MRETGAAGREERREEGILNRPTPRRDNGLSSLSGQYLAGLVWKVSLMEEVGMCREGVAREGVVMAKLEGESIVWRGLGEGVLGATMLEFSKGLGSDFFDEGDGDERLLANKCNSEEDTGGWLVVSFGLLRGGGRGDNNTHCCVASFCAGN